MLKFEEAKQIAKDHVNQIRFSDNDSLVIIDEEVVEKEYAWLFPCTSKKYQETGDINFAIAGNGPLFVSKLDGKISAYRTGLSLEEMIDEHEEENEIWMLSLSETLASSSLLELKKTLSWSQEQLIEFRSGDDRVVDRGSKRRLTQVQVSLGSVGIESTLISKDFPDAQG